MSKLTKQEVLKLAKLCKLSLSDEEIIKFQNELSDILSYVDMLSDVDVTGLEPTYQVTGLVNATRQDKVITYQASPDDLMAGVPKRDDRYIRVGKIL
jgi:aspartyl-tRNA(Asn)/glutamyl-tRNA(Gln) amidotransferase subunit C